MRFIFYINLLFYNDLFDYNTEIPV